MDTLLDSGNKTAVPETPALTTQQIVAEATNDPALAQDEFKLGDRTFKVLSLGYDEYLEFCSYLTPLFGAVAGLVSKNIREKQGVEIPGIDLNTDNITPGSLLAFAKKDLPTMVAIICNMEAIVSEDPTKRVDALWVKKHAKTPWQLADIVMKQVAKNNIIGDFASFFVQTIPGLMALGIAKKTPAQQ